MYHLRTHQGIAAALLILAAAPSARAGSISAVYEFKSPRVIRLDGGFSRIVFAATRQAGRPGEPAVPFRGAKVLIPDGEAVTGMRLIREGWTLLPEGTRLYPQQLPSSSGLERDPRPRLFNASAYQRDEWIDPPASGCRTGYLCGHPVATMAFTPVSYNPAAGRAGYYSRVEIVLDTAPVPSDPSTERLLRNDGATMERLARLVDNPEAAACPSTLLQAPSAQGAYDYLIITSEGLEGSFARLALFYDMRGIRTRIMTVQDIESSYPGTDPAEMVRNAIINEYISGGITRVLLAGDGDPSGINSVPFRGLYCSVQSDELYEDDSIPADIYFSNLDGDWNGDGDSYWGEPGEEDPFSEISVGRAPVDTPAEADAFIHKTVSYQGSPVVSDAESAVMLGEKLYSDPLTWGGDEMDQLIDTCSAYGFYTEGIPPGFSIEKYYDRDLGTWSKASLIDAVNAGTGWVCHSGHSNQVYAMRLVMADIDTSVFTNDGLSAAYPIIYTYGCYAGAFDFDDCIAEQMVAIGSFASAVLCNSRYGWFTEGTTNGPSHHFQREFFDAVFREGITEIGAANADSKDETVPFLDLPDEYEPGAHRWCFYTLNLLGDPAMDAWTGTPSPISAYHAPALSRSDSIFQADTDAPGALGALFWDGVCYGSALASGSGSITVPIDEDIPLDVDSLVFTLTAHDRLVFRDTVLVSVEMADAGTAPAAAALDQNSPNPFNPSTVIVFSIPCSGHVTITAFDVSGRKVDSILDRRMEAGVHRVTWQPSGLAAGVYFYRLRAGGATITRKAVLIR